MKMPDTEPANMGKLIEKTIAILSDSIGEIESSDPLSFTEYLCAVVSDPKITIRNIDQIFFDALKHNMGEGKNEDPDDPETINYLDYDTDAMFVKNADFPYFMDRLFANRLITLSKNMKSAQQNKIYIFRGPHGCGKSTFLNELLAKIQNYCNTDKGRRYETVWRFPRKMLCEFSDYGDNSILKKLSQLLDNSNGSKERLISRDKEAQHGPINSGDDSRDRIDDYVEVPCPSHDNPLLMIPKKERREFLDNLFKNNEFKWKLSTEKEYEWLFRDKPCTICGSLYEALLDKLGSTQKVLQMLYARPCKTNRRLGQGISIFNPGDKPLRNNVLSNSEFQKRINQVLGEGVEVKYIFSEFAKTQGGIYALMDIKSHNTERLIELHNIISEGVHKVEDIEENVNSLLLAVMNPEDEKNIQGYKSFLDRVEYITIPYVMDINTETKIYRNIFGKHIDEKFLPRVLYNFSRVIISTRLNHNSKAMDEWINDSGKYRDYCDDSLQLLKMEIYTGYPPAWLKEEDRKNLTAKRRRNIIDEAETEGEHGISGRDSIKIFNKFFSMFAKKERPINMGDLVKFFNSTHKDVKDLIPDGFMDSVLRMYDYSVLQEVKAALFYYSPKQISKDIQNYMFAVTHDTGATEKCPYTKEKLSINEDFFKAIEDKLLGSGASTDERMAYRYDTRKEYTTDTLPQNIGVSNLSITETTLYKRLLKKYVYNLKEKVLDPFLDNENFYLAIKQYNTEHFKTHDKRIRDDITRMITGLCKPLTKREKKTALKNPRATRQVYTEDGAKEVCMYVIDSKLAIKFAGS